MIKIVEKNYTPKRFMESTARKVSQDFLQELIDTKVAEDITDNAEDFVNNGLRKIYFSTGTNGIDGAGFIDDDGKMYVIIGTNPSIYKIFNEN